MVSNAKRIVIVGAGHAGGALAAHLRQYQFEGSITLVGSEELPPYQRPPLSKVCLTGPLNPDELLLRPESFYEQKDIDLLLGTQVIAIDRGKKQVSLAAGAPINYDFLVLACGASARELPVAGAQLNGVHHLRTVDDATRLKATLKSTAHLAIIGGGVIGLEVAASAREMGINVTIIEQQDSLLTRLASPDCSRFFKQLHESRGVDFLLGAQVYALHGDNGNVQSVQLQDQILPCDAVLVGIGSSPNISLTQQAGLSCNKGVLVDHNGITSDPNILAIGDMTQRPVLGLTESICLESVPSALEQAKIAASYLAGRPAAKEQNPWFWSDQYDIKYQVAGLPSLSQESIMRGDMETGSFSIFHFADEQLVAVESINAPRDFMMARKAIDTKQSINPELLADNTKEFKAALA